MRRTSKNGGVDGEEDGWGESVRRCEGRAPFHQGEGACSQQKPSTSCFVKKPSASDRGLPCADLNHQVWVIFLQLTGS